MFVRRQPLLALSTLFSVTIYKKMRLIGNVVLLKFSVALDDVIVLNLDVQLV